MLQLISYNAFIRGNLLGSKFFQQTKGAKDNNAYGKPEGPFIQTSFPFSRDKHSLHCSLQKTWFDAIFSVHRTYTLTHTHTHTHIVKKERMQEIQSSMVQAPREASVSQRIP